MKGVSEENFGLFIAYLLPGFIAVWGASVANPSVEVLLFGLPKKGAELGGFLYATVASVFAGLTASTVRWLVIDSTFSRFGIKPGAWDFRQYGKELPAYDALTQIHYRYYQFYANSVVSILFAYVVVRLSENSSAIPVGYGELWLLALCGLYLLGARDTLKRYYERLSALLDKGSQE